MLGAEAVRKAFRARRAEEGGKSTTGASSRSESGKESAKPQKEEGIRPGETLREYNRYMWSIGVVLDQN